MHYFRFVFFAVWLPCAISAAQTLPTTTSEEVQQVEISANPQLERRLDTAAKTIISHSEITRFGDTNLNDVLKRLPGVTMVGNSISLRGLGNGYTQILLNGELAPPGFALDSLTPDSIERIEIIRSASAEVSTQAIAGSINLITKKVVRKQQKEAKYTLSDEAGLLSSNLHLQRADKDGPFSYTITLAANHSQSSYPSHYQIVQFDEAQQAQSLSDNAQRNHSRYDGMHINPRLQWKLANGDQLNWQSFARINRSNSHSLEENQDLLAPSLLYRSSQNHSVATTSTLYSKLNWVHEFNPEQQLDTSFGVNFSRRRAESLFQGDNAIALGRVLRASETSSKDSGLTWTGKLSSTQWPQHTLVAGWDAAISQRRDTRLQSELRSPDSRSANPPIDEHFSVAVQRLALFAQDEWQLTPRHSLYLGLRWEGVQTESSGNTIATSRNRSSVFSPIVQTLWKLPNSPNSQVRLALARTYKAPFVGNLSARRILANDNRATSPDYQGNPGLRPELAWGLDGALEYYPSGGGILSISSYLRRISDLTGQSLRVLDGRWLSMPDNLGTARSYGIELEAKFALQSWFASAPALDLRFNLNRNWSRVPALPGPDNRLENQPRLTFNLGADYTMRSAPLSLGGNFGWQSAGWVRTTLYQRNWQNPRRTLDVYGLWKWNKNTQMRTSLGNLLAQDEQSGHIFLGAGGSEWQNETTPRYRSLRISLEHKF